MSQKYSLASFILTRLSFLANQIYLEEGHTLRTNQYLQLKKAGPQI